MPGPAAPSPTARLWCATVLAASLLAACGDPPSAVTYGGGDVLEPVRLGDYVRWYRVHVPATLEPGRPAPLILAYHGVGINARQMEEHTGLNAVADSSGIIVVYPESAVGYWDVDGDLEDVGLDDIAFTRRIIERIADAVAVDRDRVLAVGLSNGGLFVQRLGCELTDRLVGFVSVSATMRRNVAGFCRPRSPISTLFVLGSDDTFFPIEGSDRYLPLDSTLGFWATHNACAGPRTTEMLPDTAGDGTIAYRSAWAGCAASVRVEPDSIAGGGHGWPGAARPLNPAVIGVTSRNLSANHDILRFLDGASGSR